MQQAAAEHFVEKLNVSAIFSIPSHTCAVMTTLDQSMLSDFAQPATKPCNTADLIQIEDDCEDIHAMPMAFGEARDAEADIGEGSIGGSQIETDQPNTVFLKLIKAKAGRSRTLTMAPAAGKTLSEMDLTVTAQSCPCQSRWILLLFIGASCEHWIHGDCIGAALVCALHQRDPTTCEIVEVEQ